MKKEKRGLKINLKINLTNRWLYTLIVIGILAIISVGVYAIAGVSHSADELLGVCKPDGTDCPAESDPTVLASVKDGVSWSELSGIPSGFADGIDDTGASGGTLSCTTRSSVEDKTCNTVCSTYGQTCVSVLFSAGYDKTCEHTPCPGCAKFFKCRCCKIV